MKRVGKPNTGAGIEHVKDGSLYNVNTKYGEGGGINATFSTFSQNVSQITYNIVKFNVIFSYIFYCGYSAI
jgi:hypothetical protein